MELSQKLKDRRKELNLSQEEVATKIHVSRQTISNWETGRTLPDITSLVLISDIYEISLDSLIKGDQEVMKSLNQDLKQAKQWFVTAALLNTAISLLLITQAGSIDLKLVMLLQIIQTIMMGYIGISGYKFLKENQQRMRRKYKQPNSKFVLDENYILYGATIVCGLAALVSTLLTIG